MPIIGTVGANGMPRMTGPARVIKNPVNASARAPQDPVDGDSPDDPEDDGTEENATARTPDPAGTKPHSEGAALTHVSNASTKRWNISGDESLSESLSEMPEDGRKRQIHNGVDIS